MSAFCIHIQFTPPKTAFKKTCEGFIPSRKDGLGSFWTAIPAKVGYVGSLRYDCDGQPPSDGNLSHTSIWWASRIFEAHSWRTTLAAGVQLKYWCHSTMFCFVLPFLPFYVWICAVAKPFWDSSISKRAPQNGRFQHAPNFLNRWPWNEKGGEEWRRKGLNLTFTRPVPSKPLCFLKITSCTPLLSEYKKCIQSLLSDAFEFVVSEAFKFASRLVKAHKLPVKERRAKPPREGQGTFGVLARLSWDWCYRDGSAILEQMMHHAYHCICTWYLDSCLCSLPHIDIDQGWKFRSLHSTQTSRL